MEIKNSTTPLSYKSGLNSAELQQLKKLSASGHSAEKISNHFLCELKVIKKFIKHYEKEIVGIKKEYTAHENQAVAKVGALKALETRADDLETANDKLDKANGELVKSNKELTKANEEFAKVNIDLVAAKETAESELADLVAKIKQDEADAAKEVADKEKAEATAAIKKAGDK